ncbi:MAG: hypothetical protein HN521_22990 [Candidatus Latescibacteria bacterium]|nr:hypothetical protein [Candidatus Latescibacterota bacterium]
MKKWLLIILLCVVGCDSANPITPEPDPGLTEITFDNVPVNDLLTYIAVINGAFPSIETFYAEYGGITGEAVSGLVTPYWTRQYTLNMIGRIHAILAMLHDLRPPNPYLRQLHIEEFEGAFVDYLDGVTYFEDNIDVLSAEILDGVNLRMGAGNVHLIRLQIFLSDLAGGDVTFGGQQGGGDGQSIGV